MQVTRCDICGGISEDNPTKLESKYPFNSWELCASCWKKFLKWIKSQQQSKD